MPDFSAALVFLKKPIDDLFNSSSGYVQKKISGLRATAKIKSLHKKLYESQRVKTIWNTDRPLSLTSFYYPVSVSYNKDDKRFAARLTALDDLPDNCNIIFGTVGQGKSILLRYLLGKEIKSGTRIPVLCELRNVGDKKLEEHVCEKFSALLGIKNDQDIFVAFGKSGKLTLLLDGFDEIEPANINKLIQEIEDLSYKFELCRIVVSSRPDSECRHLTKFSAIRIEPLNAEDIEPFYRKITRDFEFTNRLVAAVKTSPLKIQGLVRTPLLATLLAISYRAAHKIPLDFAEFYDELFQILLVRHDGSKLGWRRQRKTKLNDNEIQEIFEAFCFATRKRRVTTVERDIAYELARESIAECQYQVDPQFFLDDINKITCLLVDEGKKISFVHLSVQEFFASRYIKTRSEKIAASFYQQLLKTGKWQNWQEELLFLRQIDSHRLTKYFLLPDIDATISDLFGPAPELSVDSLHRYLNSIAVNKTISNRDGNNVTNYTVAIKRNVITQHYRRLDSIAYSVLFSTEFEGSKHWRVGFDANPASIERTYLEIANDRGAGTPEALNAAVINTANSLVAEKNQYSESVRYSEKPRPFIDID